MPTSAEVPGRPHRLSPSTHTVEMTQIADLNRRLGEVPGPTAGELGLEGLTVRSGPDHHVAPTAHITRVAWDGNPEFPNLFAVFGSGTGGSATMVPLHTAALRELSHRLGLRHTWGVGPSRPVR